MVWLSLATLLLPGPSCLRLTGISTDDPRILLDLTATRDRVSCPSCAARSSRVHGSYTRILADLPWAGVPVLFHLSVRRFVWAGSDGARRTCSEPLPEVAAPSARRSRRLAHEHRQLG